MTSDPILELPDLFLAVVLVLLVVSAAVLDLRRGRIPDSLTLPVLGLGLVFQAVCFGWGEIFDRGLSSALLGLVFGGGLFGGLYLWGRRMDAGDVKLVAAVGALAGFPLTLVCLLISSCLGAVLGLGWLWLHPERRLTVRRFARNLFRWKSPPPEEQVRFPYSLAIASGVIGGLWWWYGLWPLTSRGGSWTLPF